MIVLDVINQILNWPLGFIQANSPGEFWTFVLCLGWLYIVLVGILLVILLATQIICSLPLVTTLLARRLTYRSNPEELVLLGLGLPADMAKSAYATDQLHVLLQGLAARRNILERLARRKLRYSLEITGTRIDGIQYVLGVPENEVQRVSRNMSSYLPGTTITRVTDYADQVMQSHLALVTELCLSSDFVLPLQEHTALDMHDPFAYLLGHMAQLTPEELIALQLVVSPVRRSTHVRALQRVGKIQSIIASGKELQPELARRLPGDIRACLLLPFWLVGFVFAIIGGVIASLLGQDASSTSGGVASDKRQSSDLYEQELAGRVKAKLSQDLFEVSLRILVVSDSAETISDRTAALVSAYSTFASPDQSLTTRRAWPLFQDKHMQVQFERFRARQLTPELLSCGSIVSNSELSSLYHFPHSKPGEIDGVTTSLSRTLLVPPVIKRRSDNNEFDVILGRGLGHSDNTSIGLTAKEREKHVAILGSTGNGKTTLMLYAIIQDIKNGKGIAVIDPHGDLTKAILQYIPKERVEDVVYLNPVDIGHPFGLNFLELPTGLSEDELLLEKGRITSAVVSVMRKVFSDDEANAHRIEAVLRNTIRTAFTVEGATLFTLLKLLRNEKFRKDVVSKLDDEDLKDFWNGEAGKAGDMQLVNMTKGVTQRLDRFNSSEPVRRVFEQAKSTINFEDIMNSGKILICNLAHGQLEEDEASLFGTTILAELKVAAERRVKIPEDERRPFYVYVDEFQNFATTPFVKMLSSSRKYKLFLTIAEQSTMQQDNDRLTQALLANVSTVVCFRTGSHVDEELMLHKFEPFLKKGDISNLPAHHFYIRIQAEQSIEPLSATTIVLPKEEASRDIAAAVEKASRDRYTKEYVKPVKADEPKKPSGGKRKSNTVSNAKGRSNGTSSNDSLDADDDA